MKIFTYDKKKRIRVYTGEVNQGVFTRVVDESKHLMVKMDAFAEQEDVIDQLINLNVHTIILKTDKNIYTSKLARWLQSDIKVLDYGHGKQRFLPRKYMNTEINI
jgi:hypothetical protein